MNNPVASIIDWVTTNESTKASTAIAVFSATGLIAMGGIIRKARQYEREINETVHTFNEKYASENTILDQLR